MRWRPRLPIVRALLAAHCGTIGLLDAVQDAAFEIRLPPHATAA